MPTTRRSIFRSLRSRAASLVALALASPLASCSDPVGPHIARQNTPFYYYEGQKIYLRVEGSLLTASPEVAGDSATLRAVLVREGLEPVAIRLLWGTDDWLVQLPSGTSTRRAEYAARALRLDDGVRFASAAYRGLGDDCLLFVVNRLTVRFRPDANPAAIARLNTATGVRNERLVPGGTQSYRFPARLEVTPLELAAHYHHQGIVQWAEADLVSGCMSVDAVAPAP